MLAAITAAATNAAVTIDRIPSMFVTPFKDSLICSESGENAPSGMWREGELVASGRLVVQPERSDWSTDADTMIAIVAAVVAAGVAA